MTQRTARWRSVPCAFAISASLVACASAAHPPAQHLPPERASIHGAREVTPSDALARRVATTAGFDPAQEVAEVRFRYVERAGNDPPIEVQHRWDVRGSRDHVTWSEGGHAYDIVVDLLTRTATGTVDGRPVVGAAATAAGELAYSRWLHDAYWLSLPLTLREPSNRFHAPPPLHLDHDDPLRLSVEEPIHSRPHFEDVEVLERVDPLDFDL